MKTIYCVSYIIIFSLSTRGCNGLYVKIESSSEENIELHCIITTYQSPHSVLNAGHKLVAHFFKYDPLGPYNSINDKAIGLYEIVASSKVRKTK